MNSLRILIALLLLTCCLVGQQINVGGYKFTAIDNDRLYDLLTKSNNIDTVGFGMLKDKNYYMPEERWVTNVLTPAFKKVLSDNKSTSYEENANDCDKFTSYAVDTADLIWYHSVRPTNSAITVGSFDYITKFNTNSVKFEGHELVFIVATRNGSTNPVVIYYEPQFQQEQVIKTKGTIDSLFWRM